MKKIFILVNVMLLSACIFYHHPKDWYKEGVSAEDTRTKLAQCSYEVSKSGIGFNERYLPILYCMEADGFRQR